MNARVIILLGVVVGLAAVVAYDLQLRDASRDVDAQRASLLDRVATAERASSESQKEIELARAKLASLRESTAKTPKAATPAPTVAVGKPNPPTSFAPARGPASVARDTQLRDLSVRAYVGERRMYFAGLFFRLGFTVEQLQRFDAIQAEYQQGVLDAAAGEDAGEAASARSRLADARDTQLRALFGNNYDAWEEANRTQGARAMVGQLLQQTFQAGGPTDNAQSEQLIAMVARHQRPRSAGGNDWPAITADAATILSGPQLEAFKTAVAFREASERMNAMTSPGR